MTDSPASTGHIVPSMYIGQPDYVLTVSDEHAESFDIMASVDGKPIITGHRFGPPASGGNDPRDDPGRLASVFGAFLGAAMDSANYALAYPQYAEDGIWDGWTIHDSDADLSDLADACSQYGDEESAC